MDADQDQDQELTVTEAARELGIPARTVRDRLERAHVRGRRVGDWLWLIPRAEVERLRRERPPRGRPRRPVPAPAPTPTDPA